MHSCHKACAHQSYRRRANAGSCIGRPSCVKGLLGVSCPCPGHVWGEGWNRAGEGSPVGGAGQGGGRSLDASIRLHPDPVPRPRGLDLGRCSMLRLNSRHRSELQLMPTWSKGTDVPLPRGGSNGFLTCAGYSAGRPAGLFPCRPWLHPEF